MPKDESSSSTDTLLRQLLEEQQRTTEEQRRTADLIGSLIDELRKARRAGRKRADTVARNANKRASATREKAHQPTELQIAAAKRAIRRDKGRK